MCVRGTALNFPNINHPKWFTQVLRSDQVEMRGPNCLKPREMGDKWRVGSGKATFNTKINKTKQSELSQLRRVEKFFALLNFPISNARRAFSFIPPEMTFFSITFAVLSQSDIMGRTRTDTDSSDFLLI